MDDTLTLAGGEKVGGRRNASPPISAFKVGGTSMCKPHKPQAYPSPQPLMIQ